MPMTSVPVQLVPPPVEFLPEDLREPVERYQRLVTDMHEAGTKVRQLAQQIPNAEAADRKALADALRDGKKDPGTPNSDKMRKEADEARRRHDAYQTAVQDARAELEHLIEQARTDWHKMLAGIEADASEAFTEAVAELDTIHRRMHLARCATDWLDQFPRRATMRIPDPEVAGTRWSQLVNGMRHHAQPVTPPVEMVHVDEKLDPLDAA